MSDYFTALKEIEDDLSKLETDYQAKCLEMKKEYIANKEVLMMKHKKITIKPYTCDCGSVIYFKNKSQHELSHKHIFHRIQQSKSGHLY